MFDRRQVLQSPRRVRTDSYVDENERALGARGEYLAVLGASVVDSTGPYRPERQESIESPPSPRSARRSVTRDSSPRRSTEERRVDMSTTEDAHEPVAKQPPEPVREDAHGPEVFWRSLLGTPRIRKDWHNITSDDENDRLKGRVTADESLWQAIIHSISIA